MAETTEELRIVLRVESRRPSQSLVWGNTVECGVTSLPSGDRLTTIALYQQLREALRNSRAVNLETPWS